MQRGRSSTHSLPNQAIFLRNLPSSTASLADLQQWTRNAAVLDNFISCANPGSLQQLIIGSDLPDLLCSSFEHSLQLLAAAPGAAADGAAADGAALPWPVHVFLALAHSTCVLFAAGGELATARSKLSNEQMLACVESSGEQSIPS
jgi:hypothetical protein